MSWQKKIIKEDIVTFEFVIVEFKKLARCFNVFQE